MNRVMNLKVHFSFTVFVCVCVCIGLKRSGKSCRLRWVNYLHPGLKHGRMSPQEEQLVLQLHSYWGNRLTLVLFLLLCIESNLNMCDIYSILNVYKVVSNSSETTGSN